MSNARAVECRLEDLEEKFNAKYYKQKAFDAQKIKIKGYRCEPLEFLASISGKVRRKEMKGSAGKKKGSV